MYDIEKIKEELKPINIIRYLGVKYKRSGRNVFILCPEHEERTGRADRNIGNCIIGDTFRNAYHCFGCGASGDCFKLIALLEGLDLKEDFIKVLTIAAEACGGEQLFQVETKGSYKKSASSKNEKNIDTISKQQQNVIGLAAQNFPYTVTECFDASQISDPGDLVKDVDFDNVDDLGFPAISYLNQKNMAYSIIHLANEDPEAYEWLVKTKAQEAMDHYKELALHNWKEEIDMQTETESDLRYFYESLKDFYKAKYLEAESVGKPLFTDEEFEDIDDGWVFGYDMKQKKD